MGRNCCVPGCRSNYHPQDAHVTVFGFPKDEERRKEWIRKIHRDNFCPSATAVVCIKHFPEQFIEREIRALRADGTEICVKRKTLTLTKDAYPSIFYNQPSYMTSEPAPKRRNPDERRAQIDLCNENLLACFKDRDVINNFNDIVDNVKIKIDNKVWYFSVGAEYVSIFKTNFSECPQINICIKIKSDLKIEVWHQNILLPKNKYCWILGKENICDKWSKFDTLISHFNSYNETNCCVEDKLSYAIKLLNEYTDENSTYGSKIKFLVEQLVLFGSSKPYYSTSTLIWACMLFYSNPSAYKQIRASNVLKIPHPMYLQKLSLDSDMLYSGLTESHLNYLKKKMSSLTEDEKFVNLLLDEIHVKPNLTYSAGKIQGSSENSNSPASSLQAFMITSLMSKNKDIVALYPVQNLNAESLHTLIKTVLVALHKLGFKVIALISDNNRINRNAFERICNGSLKKSIPHPYDPQSELFFLFDTVHLFKCIRNNWLNVKDPIQTFVFPPFDGNNHEAATHSAPLKSIKLLYDEEKNSLVKHAPDCHKKCYILLI